ncbi:hypothetical protein BABINDRAFT_160256 [Babjeviella inositovora NRRL Y-12698]|uniref:Uncharacterized protein n=1 Tax=Babjeviella inositovora NRRL Y-12698 TaxID=984486 RepID=A0A1E3QWN5_9ASCO|nr:uncharacterized protein BABINDRAFT_160256 [Babjeviella inositovora NRRL Y-12698]ODQ82051.1 hypothetical protein BABINDRAFT_160256 [Babjeviella inositovora NRRL Y-12698]
MASRSINKNRRYKYAAGAAAVVVGAGFLLLNTFPHLRQNFFGLLSNPKSNPKDTKYQKPAKSGEEEDNELADEAHDEEEAAHSRSVTSYTAPQGEVEQWSHTELKEWLESKEIFAPEDAPTNDLVSLASSLIKEI